MNKNSLAPLIVEAERVLRSAVTYFKLKVPADKIVVTIQSKGRKSAVGWFWQRRWTQAAEKGQGGDSRLLHEINMSAEYLKTHNMGELLLHELAHAENCHNDVQDCAGRVHNKKFKVMAEALGLEVKERDSSVGYGYTDLGEGAKVFLEKCAFRRELFELHRPGKSGVKAKVPGSRMLKAECPKCGYVARITRTWLDVGLPTCPCGKEMVEA